MKNIILLSAIPIFLSVNVHSQSTANDGDWKAQYVKMQNTPEAAWMIRYGDIDNLGFGWEKNFDPFSGKETPSHPYPWDRNPKDTIGFDMIMLPSSMGTKDEPCGGDGYSGQYDSIKFKYGKTNFPFHIPMGVPKETKITTATIMMFVDDFQHPVFCSQFEAYVNGRRAPFIEKALNALNQTGPIGKMITLNVPLDFLDSLKSPLLTIYIDDATTGAGDGYAIDFIKILVNPNIAKITRAALQGTVVDQETGKPVAGAVVTLSDGTMTTTNAQGVFQLQKVSPGLAVIEVKAKGYKEDSFTANVIVGEANETRIELQK
ncbi:MAG: carboxypeptidase regulatory-like domain-containing protein [Bacteroidetes bacterium]|nr:carboxypeptidase regulatory-like domain-containing protein [Bacteroidota bacterium]